MSLHHRASSPATTTLTALSCAGDDEADAVLMARIAAGSQAAFHVFARRYVARYLAVAQRIIGNSSDAEEVVQDALLRIWLHAPEWRAGSAQVSTWVYRIVVNLALDNLRRARGRWVSIDEAEQAADPAPDAQMMVEGRQLETFFAVAIAELPVRQRTALTLCYLEEISCSEAAEIMEISVSAMEALLVRGRRTLRTRLKRLADDAAPKSTHPTRPRTAARQQTVSLDLPVGRLAGSLA